MPTETYKKYINPKKTLNIKPKKIGFIGLGKMGASMAGHLAHAGHSVCVFNRSKNKII